MSFWSFCSFLSFWSLLFPLWSESKDLFQEAQAYYQEGELATTYEERKLAFNHAWFLYQTLATKSDSFTLNQALADTSFQLGEYAWAILYYQRALKENRNQPLILSHLQQAQQKLGLSYRVEPTNTNDLIPFSHFAQQFSWLLWLIASSFLTISLAIWFSWMRKLAIFCTSLLFLFLGNMLFVYYFTPIEGIVIKTTGIARAPNWSQPQLTQQPLLAGSKVQILQMTKDREWIKIENSEGVIGYIPITHIQSI